MEKFETEAAPSTATIRERCRYVATRTLIAKHAGEFEDLYRTECVAAGIPYTKRLSAAEREARAAVERRERALAKARAALEAAGLSAADL